jgi:hypothetical protein
MYTIPVRYLREDVSLEELFANNNVVLYSIENSEQDVEKTLHIFSTYKPHDQDQERPVVYRVERHGRNSVRHEHSSRDWQKETVPLDALVFVLVDDVDFDWEDVFKPDPRDEEAAWGELPDDVRIKDGVLFYYQGHVFGIGSVYEHLQRDGTVLHKAEIDLNGRIVEYHTKEQQGRWVLIQGGNDLPMEFQEIYPQICSFE